MPEYLAPGVYVEEVSFRSKSIEGVSTTTTGFIGPTRYGPVDLVPELLTSLADYERIYGDGQPLEFVKENGKITNFMWHAVRAFFEEGGTRLYVARTFDADPDGDGGQAKVELPASHAIRVTFDVAARARAVAAGVKDAARNAEEAVASVQDFIDDDLITAVSDANVAALAAAVTAVEKAIAAEQQATTLALAEQSGTPAPAADIASMKAAADEAVEAAKAARDAVGAVSTAAEAVAIKAGVVAENDAAAVEPAASADLKANVAKLAADSAKSEVAAALETISSIDEDRALTIEARFPGAAGKMRLRIGASLGLNLVSKVPGSGAADPGRYKADSLNNLDVVWIKQIQPPSPAPQIEGFSTRLGSPLDAVNTIDNRPGEGNFYLAEAVTSPDSPETFTFRSAVNPSRVEFGLLDFNPNADFEVRVLTLSVTTVPDDPFAIPTMWSEIPLDPNHRTRGSNRPDSLFDHFPRNPDTQSLAYRLPVVVSRNPRIETGLDLLQVLQVASRAYGPGYRNIFDFTDAIPDRPEQNPFFEFVLEQGNDGNRPADSAYQGKDSPSSTTKTGLKAFEDLEDISIVAAPGSSYQRGPDDVTRAGAIAGLLLSHAERMKYRIAVLDSPNEQSLTEVRDYRKQLDSKHGAFYYPWVKVLDPITRTELNLPPSGFVSGIYARNDIERAVYKAPANEVVRLALGFEYTLNKPQQEVLNPEGINAFRYFEGRGNRLWGARTISSDPEWKYVNLRRYFAYLERSIDIGTQWAVFEPNGDRLWANVRRTIQDFLFNEWQSGALLGTKPEQAFFVRCDRSTMTQNDLDNGRLICLIGVVPLRPAEFVIFRIGQATADSMQRG